jgi:hypothetical protein
MKQHKDKTEHQRVTPIEDHLDLTTLGYIERSGERIGFCLLAGNDNNSDLSNMVVKFFFRCQGIHPLQRSESQYAAINQALSKGFKELKDATVTIRWSSFCNEDNLNLSPEGLTSSVSKESYYFEVAASSRQQELVKKKFADNQI